MDCEKMNKLSDQNIWNVPINKLMLWRNNAWTKYDTKISNLYLRVHHDQLFITANSKILESFNMYQKLKGVYKEDVLILIVCNNNAVRKLKFQIKSNTVQLLEALSCHFPVLKHKTQQSNKIINAKYRNIDEVLKNAVELKENVASTKLPTQFENFVKLCLLDPYFLQVVSKTEEIFNNLKFKK